MTVVKYYTYNNLKDLPATETKPSVNEDEAQMIKLLFCSDTTYENGQNTGDPLSSFEVVMGDKFKLTKKDLNEKHKESAKTHLTLTES